MKMKALSILLTFTMILNSSFVSNIIAEENENTYFQESSSKKFTLSVDDIPTHMKLLLENDSDENVVSVRDDEDIFSVMYENEDGSKNAKVFGVPIKYFDEKGNINYIDTSIIENTNKSDGYFYTNAANSFSTDFSENAKTGVRLTKDGKAIGMSVFSDFVPELKSIEQTAEIKKAKNNGNINDEIIYPKAFGENTYLKYTNTFVGLKEEIILEKNIGLNKFSFNLYTGDLIPMLTQDDKAVVIVDSANINDVRYNIKPIYVYDSYIFPEKAEELYPHFTEECYYEMEQLEKGYYKLSLVVSKEFLNDPRTVYPVIIDPTIDFQTTSNIVDTYVTSAAPNTSKGSNELLRVGHPTKTIGDGPGHYYTYVRFKSLPTPNFVYTGISSAYLRMMLNQGQNTFQNVKITAVANRLWDETLTNNTDNLTVQLNPDAQNVSAVGTNNKYYSFYVKQSLSNWYSGAWQNYGWKIQYQNSYCDDLNSMRSANNTDSTLIPMLTITYDVPFIPTIYPQTLVNGRYFIKNQNSGKYLSYTNGYLYEPVVQDTNRGYLTQQWDIYYDSTDGCYHIYQLLNGKLLEIPNPNTNGCLASIGDLVNGRNEQKFIISATSVGNGRYSGTISTKQSNGNMVLEIQNSSSASLAPAQIWSSGVASSTWVFEPVCNPSPQTISNGIYFIKNAYSNKYVSAAAVTGHDTVQYINVGHTSQHWVITRTNDGYYRFTPLYNDEIAFDTISLLGSTTAGTYLRTQTYTNSDISQKFTIETASGGGYHIGTKQSGSYQVLGVSNANDLSAIQLMDKNNSITNDNWILEPVSYRATVNNYYDRGYFTYYQEAETVSKNLINSYTTAVSNRYRELFQLNITQNTPTYYASLCDICKGNVTLNNLYTLCTHFNDYNDILRHTYRANIIADFSANRPGNDVTTTTLWSAHRITTETSENRSCSNGNSVFMLEKSVASSRTLDSRCILMHELAHQYNAPDHYHDVRNGVCINAANGCSSSECNSVNKRPTSCLMNNNYQDISGSNIICSECKLNIVTHLFEHHR